MRVAIVETLMRGYQGSRGAGVVFRLLKTKTLGFSDGDFNKVREWIRHLEYVARGRLWAPVAGAGAGGLADWRKTTRVGPARVLQPQGRDVVEKPVTPTRRRAGPRTSIRRRRTSSASSHGKPNRESALADVFGCRPATR